MIEKKHLVYVVLILILVVGAQTAFYKCTEQRYAKEDLNAVIKSYESGQKTRDSLYLSKLNEMANREWKIQKYFYNTKELIKEDYEELQTKNDSSITDILNSWIEKRKSTSKLREAESD